MELCIWNCPPKNTGKVDWSEIWSVFIMLIWQMPSPWLRIVFQNSKHSFSCQEFAIVKLAGFCLLSGLTTFSVVTHLIFNSYCITLVFIVLVLFSTIWSFSVRIYFRRRSWCKHTYCNWCSPSTAALQFFVSWKGGQRQVVIHIQND